MAKPLIFITNDDGYQAKGINELISFLTGLGEIVVFAPDGPRSGMAGAITSLHPIRYQLQSRDEINDVTVYSCSGTPVDCVKLGISEIVGRKPDLLVSGINHGSNANICVHYSGTMGAAIEGCIFKIPSIGFSLLNHDENADFSGTREVIRSLCEKVMKDSLPDGICLNVNIPSGEVKGVKICRHAMGKWNGEFLKSKDGYSRDIYWLTGYFLDDMRDAPDTDETLLTQGYASVVPTKVDVSAYEYFEQLRTLEF